MARYEAFCRLIPCDATSIMMIRQRSDEVGSLNISIRRLARVRRKKVVSDDGKVKIGVFPRQTVSARE